MQPMNEPAIAQTESLGVLWPKKADVPGVRVSYVDYDAAVSCIIVAAKSPRASVVACYAVHTTRHGKP